MAPAYSHERRTQFKNVLIISDQTTMKKPYLFAIVPLLLGIICWISYLIIGAEVASDGRLIEPFGLIPLGYLFFFIGVVAIVIMATRVLIRKK